MVEFQIGIFQSITTNIRAKIKNLIKSSISSKYQLDNTLICRDLVKLGVTPRKSHSFKPHKSLLYSNDFWRGILDGDEI